MNQSTGTKPPRVRRGDTVAVCAPSGPVDREQLRAGLERLGARYRVRIDEGALAVDGFLAGDDERRAAELNRCLRDSDVRAIFMGRGGYGLTRILDALDAGALRADPKPIVGFSDGTALLAWALGRAGVCGIHGPVVTQLGRLIDRDVEQLFALLEDPAPPPDIRGLAPIGAASDPIEGALLGGNLCLLSNLAGTADQIDMRGAVVLLEEVGERPYAVDRYMTHLFASGALSGVAGALVGELLRCDPEPARPPDQRTSAIEAVDERLVSRGIPGLSGAPIGHGERNLAVPFGGRCRLDQAAGTVSFLEGAVA